jgi:3-deoxy-7-phosphoheptulonate synthase
MIDCSHANSGKEPARQALVAADLAAQIAGGNRAIAAVMIESNLVGGAQDYQVRPLVHGQSVTDACLACEQTLPVLAQLAEAVKARRLK